MKTVNQIKNIAVELNITDCLLTYYYYDKDIDRYVVEYSDDKSRLFRNDLDGDTKEYKTEVGAENFAKELARQLHARYDGRIYDMEI